MRISQRCMCGTTLIPGQYSMPGTVVKKDVSCPHGAYSLMGRKILTESSHAYLELL